MLISFIICLLLSNAVNLRRDVSILYSRIGVIILLYCIFFSYNNLYTLYLDAGIGLFGGLFHTSSITQFFHIFIFVITLFILNLTGFYPRKVWTKEYSSLPRLLYTNLKLYVSKIINKTGEQYTITEYTLLILFIITGSILLISSSDLVSIFLSIELQSYGLYLLCTVYRNSESSTSSGLTYFLLGGLASCFILFGIALIYANSGTTYLDSFYIISNLSDIISNQEDTTYLYLSKYISYSLLLISVGFLIKISAAPFHFWSPDVYDGIPTIVTTFVAIIAKISILVLLLELVHYTSNIYITTKYTWTTSILLSSFLSLVIGTVLGLTQSRIKRLLAFSTISHLGFLLLALGVNSIDSIQAFIFYLTQYSLSNLNAFIILIGIGFSLYLYVNDNTEINKLSEKNNSPVQLLSQIKGYFYINPFMALSFAITLFSFAGVPPLLGFFGKQFILSSALDCGYIFLVLVAVITSVISGVYYLGLVQRMFFERPDYNLRPNISNLKIPAKVLKNNETIKTIFINYSNISLSSYLTITVSILTLVILLFMFIPDEWLYMTNILSLILFIPSNEIYLDSTMGEFCYVEGGLSLRKVYSSICILNLLFLSVYCYNSINPIKTISKYKGELYINNTLFPISVNNTYRDHPYSYLARGTDIKYVNKNYDLNCIAVINTILNINKKIENNKRLNSIKGQHCDMLNMETLLVFTQVYSKINEQFNSLLGYISYKNLENIQIRIKIYLQSKLKGKF